MTITFENGILGFEEYKNYSIYEIEMNPIFKEIASIDDKNIGFIAISPFEIERSYDIEIDNVTLEELDIHDVSDVILYSIVTMNESLDNATINLRAPIVINIKNNKAKQIILQDESYSIKHPLIRGE